MPIYEVGARITVEAGDETEALARAALLLDALPLRYRRFTALQERDDEVVEVDDYDDPEYCDALPLSEVI